MAQNPENVKPRFKITINGSELQPEMMVDMLEVTVSDFTEGADMFSVLFNVWDPKQQRYKWLDDGVFDEGSEIEIKVGYIDNQESIMVGEVVAIEAGFPENEPRTVCIQGFDRLHRFRRGRKSRSFQQMKDSQIAEKIAQDLQLQAQVDDSSIVHDYVFQNNQSDIDFLKLRARRIFYEIAVKDKTLFFKKAANDQGQTISLKYGETLLSFKPRLTTVGQVNEVIVKGWNPTTREAITGRAQSGDETTQMGGQQTGAAVAAASFGNTKTFIVDMPVRSQTEADQIAMAAFNDLVMDFITGEGKAVGNTGIRAGSVIELTKLGNRFSGLYYVTSSSHIIDKQGYVTKFNVKRNSI
jgi:phage protein D